jgi:hypothetical protein
MDDYTIYIDIYIYIYPNLRVCMEIYIFANFYSLLFLYDTALFRNMANEI